MSKKVIIIGASAAGISALSTLKKLKPDWQLLCLSKESELPYNKCFLADYLGNAKQLAEISLAKSDLVEHMSLNQTVCSLKPSEQKIVLADGKELVYDFLFLGMGSSARVPQSLSIKTSLITFHTLADLEYLRSYIKDKNVKNIAILGTGLTGLECADALLQSSELSITILDRSSQALASAISNSMAHEIQACISKAGVQSYYNFTDTIILNQFDLVVCAIGSCPNNSLAKTAGVTLHEGGVVVNDYMQTNIPTIYAGGDLVIVKEQLSGALVRSSLWPDAMMQGMFAAYAIAGLPKAYPGIVPIMSSSFFGRKFACYNPAKGTDPLKYIKKGQDYYHEYYIQSDNLIGFALYGQTQQLPQLKRALITREKLSQSDYFRSLGLTNNSI